MTQTERNPTMFQGKNLRGKRFTDENFAGYDFSHIDLHSTYGYVVIYTFVCI